MIRIRALPSIPYAGVVLALSVMAAMAFAFLSHGMGVLFPFIQEDLNASRAQLGLIVSGEFIGTAATVLFTGWMADVIGVRRLLTASLIVVGVGLLLFSQIQSVLQGIPCGGPDRGCLLRLGAPPNSKAIMGLGSTAVSRNRYECQGGDDTRGWDDSGGPPDLFWR